MSETDNFFNPHKILSAIQGDPDNIFLECTCETKLIDILQKISSLLDYVCEVTLMLLRLKINV